MKKHFFTFLLLGSLSPLLLNASNRPVSTTPAHVASQDNTATLSGITSPETQKPLSPQRKRSQEKTYSHSDVTGPTGLNALTAKTRSIPT